MVQGVFSATLNVVKGIPHFANSAYPFGIPHTEEKANPMIVPVMTATIGLHQRIHPAPPADELIRYRPNPAAAPRTIPKKYFMRCALPLGNL